MIYKQFSNKIIAKEKRKHLPMLTFEEIFDLSDIIFMT
jgi:hypothetical protein